MHYWGNNKIIGYAKYAGGWIQYGQPRNICTWSLEYDNVFIVSTNNVGIMRGNNKRLAYAEVGGEALRNSGNNKIKYSWEFDNDLLHLSSTVGNLG